MILNLTNNLLNMTNCTATQPIENDTAGLNSSQCVDDMVQTSLPPFPEVNIIVLAISLLIQVLLILLIAGGNGTVLYLFAAHHQLRTVANAFVVSLAFADGLMSLALIPGLVITFDNFFVTNIYGCLLLWCSITFTSTTSCFSLLAVTYDRFIRITRSLTYHTIMTWKRVRLIIASVWGFVFAVTVVMPFAGLHRLSPDIPFNCFDFSSVFSPEYMITLLFGLGVIPFFIMCGMYTKIFIIVLEKIRAEVAMSPPPPGNATSTSNPKSEWKSIKSLLVILGFTGLAWLPFTVVLMLEVYTDFTAILALRTTLSWLTYLNSGLNPIIYSLRNDDFKRAWRRHCCFGAATG